VQSPNGCTSFSFIQQPLQQRFAAPRTITMSSLSALVDAAEDNINRVAELNDLAIEHWMKQDLVTTEQVFTNALNRLHALCHDTGIGTLIQVPELSDGSMMMTLCTPIKLGNREHPADIYDRVFLLNHKNKYKWKIGSVKVVAAALCYHVALFHQLRIQRNGDLGGTGRLPREEHRFVVRYYEKANALLGRYMEATRSPLWLFQTALWHNIGLCYQPIALSDSCAVYVYLENIKSVVNWIETEDRSFFKGAILFAELQQPHSAGARVFG
jgi:hypothetical protein